MSQTMRTLGGDCQFEVSSGFGKSTVSTGALI